MVVNVILRHFTDTNFEASSLLSTFQNKINRTLSRVFLGWLNPALLGWLNQRGTKF